ncbi:hypothetical protein BH20ACT2_BH20ACT2_23750 [soil metagenome]
MRAVAAVTALVLVAGVVAAALHLEDEDEAEAASRVSPRGELVASPSVWTFLDPPPPPRPTSFTAAHATGSSVTLFDAPGATQPTGNRTNPTHENRPLVMLVREQRAAWLRVALPQRPNGSEAWIRAAEVELRQVPNHIVIELGARRLTLFNGDQVLRQYPVGIGTGRTPTPTGDFYIDVFNPLTNTGGPYGWGQLSVSGFSDVHRSFGGGNGQIAIHGTNRPSGIGSPVSNGCVRMRDADVEELSVHTPAGTPVQIVP